MKILALVEHNSDPESPLENDFLPLSFHAYRWSIQKGYQMIRLLLLLTLILNTHAFAETKIGVMGSVLYNVPETDSSQQFDEESKLGFGLGMRALIPLTNGLSFRTGAGIVQKRFSYKIESGTIEGEADLSFIYFNVPATLYISGLDERFGVFGGTALNAKLDDDCSGSGAFKACKVTDDETIVLPIILGFDFIFTENVSMELSYEYGIMDTAKDVRVSSAVVSLIYNF